jgi:23S rRNA (uracil1939-C5)-methyltransferase
VTTATATELTIESIAAGGDGVARHEGLVVLTPRTAPGDRALVDIRLEKRLGRGILQQVLAPGPGRIAPPCPHYVIDRCGGCQLQHLAYDAQLAAKGGIIRDALVRIGRRALDAAPPVSASDRPWRYRRKLTLAMERRAGAWIAGLFPYDDPRHPFALADCPITEERVLAVWREVLAAADHLPQADRLRGAVQLGDAAGATFTLEGGREWAEVAAFAAAVPAVTGIWWQPEEGRRRLVHDRGAPGGGASFIQVNASVAAALHARVRDRARAHRPRRLVDAYAGSGATAVPLARDGVQVTAIELDREAAAVCRRELPAGSESLAGRVEDLLPRALPADVVLVNPPRTGVEAAVTAALAASPPRAIIYVSCNPATLARDVARLPQYRIASVEGFDMFPQTAHVETVCELVLEDA